MPLARRRRIAELGEGKRSHMWSVLGQYQKGGKADDAGSEWNAAPPVPRPIERDDCASREAELAEKAAALEKVRAPPQASYHPKPAPWHAPLVVRGRQPETTP